jgi:Rieske Fe-S protein
MKWATHGLGALFAAVLGIPAIAYLLDARNRPAKPGDFKTVARLSDLQDNVPKQVTISAVRKDAWTLHPNDIIGRVWLVKRGPDQVDAFTTICPHLGCSINFEANKREFLCPCHNASYDLNGDRIEAEGFKNPAPRGMDHLEWRRDPANPDLIQVKYENFKQGESTPIVKT